jgi:hypothetical protein
MVSMLVVYGTRDSEEGNDVILRLLVYFPEAKLREYYTLFTSHHLPQASWDAKKYP